MLLCQKAVENAHMTLKAKKGEISLILSVKKLAERERERKKENMLRYRNTINHKHLTELREDRIVLLKHRDYHYELSNSKHT